MGIAGRKGKGDGSAKIAAQRVDFRRSSAARGANGVMTSPPFAPAAEQWALMWVESTDPVTRPSSRSAVCAVLRPLPWAALGHRLCR